MQNLQGVQAAITDDGKREVGHAAHTQPWGTRQDTVWRAGNRGHDQQRTVGRWQLARANR